MQAQDRVKPSNQKLPIGIVGGGIGGLTLAIALRQFELPVVVFERVKQIAPVGAGISLWPNATRVLHRLGLLKALRARAQEIRTVRLQTDDGTLLSQTRAPGTFEVPSMCIHRADLHQVLLQALPQSAVRMNQEVARFERQIDNVLVEFEQGNTLSLDALIGCDGLHSVVRSQVLGVRAPRYNGYAVWRAIARAHLPEHADGIGTESWGHGLRFGVFPLDESRVYWYACANEPMNSPDSPSSKERLLSLFSSWHPPIPGLIDATEEAAIIKHSTFDRPPAKTWGSGRITLLGDAAHPMTPNLGQGACSAIEDAFVLARKIMTSGDIALGLRAYEKERLQRTTQLVNQSRRMGNIGQWSHPLSIEIRNTLMRLMPDALGDLTQRKIFSYGK
ncbi:MAG: FAD-dependent monooxygenase [Rhodothermaceae bacterium]|nr:FAD-dependent monooxygenase [Rhodothermaceae bacterium]